MDGEYDIKDIYMGVPCIINRDGIKEVIEIPLGELGKKKMRESYKVLNEIKNEVKKELDL